MRTGKVRARGQVTIPVRVRQEIGIRPGDIILFRTTGQGRGEFIVVPAHTPLDELWVRYRGPGRFDAEQVWVQVAEDMSQSPTDCLENPAVKNPEGRKGEVL